MKLKKFKNIVEHAGSGLKMPEPVAQKIDELSRSLALPKDFTYRRAAHKTFELTLNPGDRSDISFITTDDVDRDGEVVIPKGGNWDTYNRVVTFAHRYDELPCGSNIWMRSQMKGNRDGIIAKTHYPTKPDDWGDTPWLPSAVLHLMQQPVPTCTGKSIGFLPLNIRAATPQEKSSRPELDGVLMIDKWMGLEYAVTPIPCQPAAEMEMVSKSLAGGLIDKSIADFLVASLSGKSVTVTVPNHLHVKLPPSLNAAISAMTERVDDADFGEPREGHAPACDVKVIGGIHGHDYDEMQNCLKGEPPIRMKFGKTFAMTNPRDYGIDHDGECVALAVDSPDLHRIHAKLKVMGDGKMFRPHVLMAKVKAGCAAKYKDMDDMMGCSMVSDSITHVGDNEHETELALDGKRDSYMHLPDGGIAATSTCAASDPANKSGMTTDNEHGGIVVGDDAQYAQGDRMPPCPKCNMDDKVRRIADTVDDDEDMFHCDRCNTDFEAQDFVVDDNKSVKAMELNHACVSRAKRLIAEGKVNHGEWSAPVGSERKAEDCLATVTGASDAAKYKYPIIKGGELYARAVGNAEARAEKNNAPAVAAAAKNLSELIKKHGGKSLLDVPGTVEGDYKRYARAVAGSVARDLDKIRKQAEEDQLTLAKGG